MDAWLVSLKKDIAQSMMLDTSAQLVLALAVLLQAKRPVVGEQFLRVDGPLPAAPPKLAEEYRAAGDVLYGDVGLAAAAVAPLR